MTHTQKYLEETALIAQMLDCEKIDVAASVLSKADRLFIIGVGGSAANASHAVNDFRKIARIEAYAPTDNVAEFTARTNDEGWESTFHEWLKVSRLCSHDCLMILSVGGGSETTSRNIVKAADYAHSLNTPIIGIVGRNGGYTATIADCCIMIPTVNPDHITPHAESFQAVVWHLLVNHPLLHETH